MTVATVSAEDVFKERSQGAGTPILDVRSAGEFAALHAAGARSAPLDQLNPAALLRNPSDRVYLICQSGTRAAMAYEKFRAAGFDQVCCVEGGTVAWEKAGLPVVRGARGVISLERQVRLAAGTLVLLGVVLGWLVHPAILLLSGFVGAGLIFSAISNTCGMGLLLMKMPWNRAGGCCGSSPSCNSP